MPIRSFLLILICTGLGASAQRNIVVFSANIHPELEEVKDVTNAAILNAVKMILLRDRTGQAFTIQNNIESHLSDIPIFCENNAAYLAIVPHVTYFKVGFGRYILSNQVQISLDLYNANGNLIHSSHYDTLKRNIRIVGNTHNSLKMAAKGVMKDAIKYLDNNPNFNRTASHEEHTQVYNQTSRVL